MNLMRKIALATVLVGALIGRPAFAEPPRISITQTEVASEDLLSRTELLAKGMPWDSDVYFVGENNGGNGFCKLRGQLLPARYKSLEIGIAAQHVDGTNFDAHDDAGPALRISGRPSEDSYAKLDLRYFPSQHCFDTYGLYSQGNIFADVLGSYDTVTHATTIRPGIDYRISDHASAGIEARFANGKTDYVGARMKVSF